MERTRAALEKHSGSVSAAAREMGVGRSAMQHRRDRLARGVAPPTQPVDPVAARGEDRSAAFWRTRAKEFQKELADAENLLGHVSGLLDRPLAPPAWAAKRQGPAPSHRVAGLLHISDVHAGEIVDRDEILGINAYDPDICKRRLRRLFSAAIDILPRWAADATMTGVVVALNGDLISGGIHEELRETQSLTSIDQAWFVADELAAGIQQLADKFGAVYVVVTCGNHGRTTLKTHSKHTARLSYDSMVGEMLRRHFDADPRVNVYVSPSRDAVYPILGWTIFQTHGDAMGTGGGKGFGGPMFPIVRGTKLVEWQAGQVKRDYDILLTAHYHTSGNPGKVLANGSVVGYAEYANGLRASPEPPQQWLALISETWCLRERADIKLEDPARPEKPRVRVPATMR